MYLFKYLQGILFLTTFQYEQQYILIWKPNFQIDFEKQSHRQSNNMFFTNCFINNEVLRKQH